MLHNIPNTLSVKESRDNIMLNVYRKEKEKKKLKGKRNKKQ